MLKLMADPSLLMETRSTSALFKRAEQLRRWDESETNRESCVLKSEMPRRIKFTDECVFLAACSSCDKDEVKRLLAKGANIDTANVDGLTALHQSCIDDNYDMVEFLVAHGADVNCGDNEGWTPLHATASCGFVSIASYLIENGANVAAVNNDGELPLDIAESEDMEELLQHEIDKRGINCELARKSEELMMLEDANQMLNSKHLDEKRHPKTGATALHVASAKGYIKVMRILIQAGFDINAQDYDGWTPLHASAHWGQAESCRLLVDELCDMEIKNYSGQHSLDVADPDVVELLQELKKKQIALRKERPELQSIMDRRNPPMKRRTSVTRMSGSDKTNAIMKDKNQERTQIETNLQVTEKVSPVNSNESESEESSSEVSSSSEDSEVESTSSSSESVDSNKSSNNESDGSLEKKNKANIVENNKELIGSRENVNDVKPKEPIKNRESREPPVQAPPMPPKVESEENDSDVPSWRRAVKKVSGGSTANSTETATVNRNSEPNDEVVLRSSSGSRISGNSQIDKDAKPGREGQRPASAEPTRDDSRRDEPPAKRERPHTVNVPATDVVPPAPATQPPVPSPVVPLPPTLTVAIGGTTTTAAVTVTPSTPSLTPTPGTPSAVSSNQIRRSFVPPVRDEESETQRKAHAKRVRETRRSTQGVTLEDLKSAEQLVQKKGSDTETEPPKVAAAVAAPAVTSVPEPAKAKEATATTTAEAVRTGGATVERRPSWRVRQEQDEIKASQDDSPITLRRPSNDVSATVTLASRPVVVTTTTDDDLPPYTRLSRPASITQSTAAVATVTATTTTNSAALDADTTVTFTIKARPASKVQSEEEDLKEQDKENEESKSSTQATQATITRRRRPKRRSTGVAYLDGLEDGESEKVEVDGERVESRIENKSESDDQKQAIGDRGYRSARYGSTSSLSESGSRADSRAETPSRLSDRAADRLSRASSVSSTAAATQNDDGEKDYKKLYEEQKVENDRLIDKLKKSDQELEDAKSQIEKASQNNARNSASDAERRERRALERKLSEMEEELKQLEPLRTENQRLRDENGALIRVISKLSK